MGAKRTVAGFAILVGLAAAVGPVPAVGAGGGAVGPDVIALPNGWRPEGITLGGGHDVYVGSLGTGAVYRADLRSGEGEVAVPAQAGRIAVGLDHDRRSGLLFVAGGPGGQGYVYDAGSGAPVAAYAFATAGPTFVNDVIVTRDAAWFTDSFRPNLYRVPLDPAGRPGGTFSVLPIGGDYAQGPGFNLNGIVATPDGRWLIVVQSGTGSLFRVDPATGEATQIDLGGASVPNGDGLDLVGRTLYVMQNQLNQIAEVSLSPDLASGEVTDLITDDDFDVPATIAVSGSSIYAVNARFTTPPTPDTDYAIVRVDR